MFTLNKINTDYKKAQVSPGKGFTTKLIKINQISPPNELRKGCLFLLLLGLGMLDKTLGGYIICPTLQTKKLSLRKLAQDTQYVVQVQLEHLSLCSPLASSVLASSKLPEPYQALRNIMISEIILMAPVHSLEPKP